MHQIIKLKVFLLISVLVCKVGVSQQFGRYGDCNSGRGVCGIGADETIEKSSSKYVLQKYGNDSLIIKLLKGNISSEDELLIFGKKIINIMDYNKETFIIEQNLLIPENVKTILAIPKKVIGIKLGNYRIVNELNYYKVYVKLY